MKTHASTQLLACWCALSAFSHASMLSKRTESSHQAFLNERRLALPALSDPFGTPPVARAVIEDASSSALQYPWKRNIAATVFWVGEQPSENNPTPNNKSSWDTNWQENFGGYDDPNRRSGFLPAQFTPRLNPFYIALPFNDVIPGGIHHPKASEVIPWFWQKYQGDGISVCKGRWVAIHQAGRVCYAQWEDVGPFATDHWAYVFGSEGPRPNRNNAAGIDVSPAVRDFLQLKLSRPVEWRFVEDYEVPNGPWLTWKNLNHPTLPYPPKALPPSHP